jgi:osmotically-inducible protein OsmY
MKMPFEIRNSELRAVRQFLSSFRDEERESLTRRAFSAGGVPLRGRIARTRPHPSSTGRHEPLESSSTHQHGSIGDRTMIPFDDPTECDRATSAGAGVGELAEDRLRGSPYLSLRAIGCVDHAGAVTLSGCVPTYYLKQLAQEVVAGTEGVRAIVNRIEVMAPSSKPR